MQHGSYATVRRSAQASVEEDASKLEFGPEFNDVPCLLNSEVFALLDTQKQQKLANVTDPAQAERMFTNAFNKTYKYVKTFNRYKNSEMIREVRSSFGDDLNEFEMAQLSNLCPESSEEAKILVPSLSRISDFSLQEILDRIQSTRKFAY